LLCPFGFCGYHHTFEIVTSTDRSKPIIRFPQSNRIVMAQTEQQVGKTRLAKHVEALGRRSRQSRWRSRVRVPSLPYFALRFFRSHDRRARDHHRGPDRTEQSFQSSWRAGGLQRAGSS
jgi:hypothetical protein